VRSYAIVEAPSHLGLRAAGVEQLPDALLDAGLATRLNARLAARLPAPPFDPRIDPETRMLNPAGLRDHSSILADTVGSVLDGDGFPIVLGGDCSILLGSALALKRRGRHGLLYLDGHADFYQPEAEPTGEAASMALAIVTGHGPAIVAKLEGRGPLVREEDTVLFAFRDAELAAAEGGQRLPATLSAIDLETARERGVEEMARVALARLTREDGPGGFWIHLDVDVLDDAVMPAVDYRLPDGLSWTELTAVLRAAFLSGHAIGLDVTIFNPHLDSGGRLARALVDALVAGLRRP
jgi:arginase